MTKDRPAELLMGENQALQSDRELDIATSNHVLNLKVQKFGGEAEFLHYSCIFPGSQTRLLLTGKKHNTHTSITEAFLRDAPNQVLIKLYNLNNKILLKAV